MCKNPSSITGALQTTCEAVDTVVSSPNPRALVTIRPPEHHDGSDETAGFCWANNVLGGVAHSASLLNLIINEAYDHIRNADT
jgi:histone deacetylase HOS3